MFALTLLVTAEAVEPLSDLLVDELGALSVSVEDADAGSAQEQALFGEPGLPAPAPGWHRSRLQALFASETQAQGAAALCLSQTRGHAAINITGIAPVPDTDWVRLTQAQFSPVEVCEGFWIVPSWHDPPSQATTVLRLDPGMAFGTGTHPTTRMCLRWIARHVPAQPPHRLLDYGCGSGILAIAAARFGALGVHAIDLDPEAVRATVANASANAVTLSAGLPGSGTGPYPVVLANILATPLKLLAPLLTESLAPGGTLVLAGLLNEQADDLVQAYAPAIRLELADHEQGWALLAGRKV